MTTPSLDAQEAKPAVSATALTADEAAVKHEREEAAFPSAAGVTAKENLETAANQESQAGLMAAAGLTAGTAKEAASQLMELQLRMEDALPAIIESFGHKNGGPPIAQGNLKCEALTGKKRSIRRTTLLKQLASLSEPAVATVVASFGLARLRDGCTSAEEALAAANAVFAREAQGDEPREEAAIYKAVATLRLAIPLCDALTKQLSAQAAAGTADERLKAKVPERPKKKAEKKDLKNENGYMKKAKCPDDSSENEESCLPNPASLVKVECIVEEESMAVDDSQVEIESRIMNGSTTVSQQATFKLDNLQVTVKEEEEGVVFADTGPEVLPTPPIGKYRKKQHNYRTHVCSVCGKGFPNATQLRNHGIYHTDEKPFPCAECPKAFRTSSNLKDHMRVHTGEKPFVCPHCLQAFNQASSMARHMRIHTGEMPFVCSICCKQFSTAGSLKYHEKTHLGVKSYKCLEPGCDKAYFINDQLQAHLKIHSGDVKMVDCPECGRQFRQASLRTHMRVHTGFRPHKCPHCERTYIQRAHLKKHCLTHTKPYTCPKCNKAFSRSQAMKVHVRKNACKDNPPFDGEAADAEPADDEPADDEPGDDEPGDVEPADDEPADAEPADDEPGDVEPADDESVPSEENSSTA